MKRRRGKFSANPCLPQELTLEILLQLPVKSLGRFKLVCKTWNSLISNHNFIKSHAKNSNNPPSPYLFDRLKQRLISTPFNDNTKNININLNPTISKNPYDYHYCGSSDGLICMCIYTLTTKLIHLFNPITTETREIQFPHHVYGELQNSWFGFVPSLNDYLIVISIVHSLQLIFHVFSMRENKWRKLLNIHGSENMCLPVDNGCTVLVDDALYFLLRESGDTFILKVDLVQRVFKKIQFSFDNFGRCQLSIGIMQDKSLCICQIYYGEIESQYILEMWKLEQHEYGHGEENSWRKLFWLNLEPCYCVSIISGFSTCRGKYLVTLYDSRRHEIEHKFLVVDPDPDPDGNPNYDIIVLPRVRDGYSIQMLDNYVETLVSPFSLV